MNRLKEVRKTKGVSQDTVAKYLKVGRTTYTKYENGVHDPDTETWKLLADFFNVSIDYLSGRDEEKNAPVQGVKIPVLGRVVAGIPIEAVTDVLDYEEITPELAATGHYFALKIKGQSMEPRICEDDVVIVRQQQEVNSGDIAIILVNGEDATIKKVVFHDNGLTLIGFNTSVYPPHFYTNEEIATLPIKIVGKVIELRGKL